MLQQYADEEDYDGILYVFSVHPNVGVLIHTFLPREKYLYHTLESPLVFRLLLLFTAPPMECVGSSLAIYSLHGRVEMLRELLQAFPNIPVHSLNVAIFELRYCQRDNSLCFPIRGDRRSSHSLFWTFFSVGEEKITCPERKQELCAKRAKCLELLKSHRISRESLV